ncbi:electron transfer flavoprotein subunit alpha/FixB family protein [Mesotoga sp. BH458_6_3_2_1]|uniref:electron transfer flavoprotein subunit alpha/FixB family protein n=1 Tax=Mesotoga sp. BH458_6_3_2_1 TaxID=1437446 RepID=UPI000EF17B3C|nr:electron transfer flavoprotein subunit alpha/FixB family protein [Mesotoga sp. BH458_6_3_2_1]RLL81984.1 electron transfer flavoprotein subunit alpha [Mesotoga sp. BH458_6_3_2_1]
MNDLLVIAEKRGSEIHSSTFELLGKARELSMKRPLTVSVVILSDKSVEEDSSSSLFSGGADRIILAVDGSFKRFNFEPYTKTLAAIVRKLSPEIVLAPATTSGRTFMPGLAALLKTGLTADCTGLDIEEGTGNLLQTRPAIGGNIMATIKTPNHRPQMATVRPKTFSPLKEEYESKGELVNFDVTQDLIQTGAKLIEFHPIGEGQKGVQDAEVIIAGGMGLRKVENMEPVYRLSKIINGTVGASRKIVDSKWIGHEAQVGLSGHTVKPKIYIAAGISGAVQHIAGMQTAEFIVAINRDRNAAIFNFADIGLVGDAVEILTELAESLESEVKR